MPRQHRAAFDEAVAGRATELDTVGSNQTDAIVKVAADAFEELEERAASQVQRIGEDTRAIRDDVRKSIAEGTTDFEKFAQKRLGELEDALRARLESFGPRADRRDPPRPKRAAEQLNETVARDRGDGAVSKSRRKGLGVRSGASPARRRPPSTSWRGNGWPSSRTR